MRWRDLERWDGKEEEDEGPNGGGGKVGDEGKRKELVASDRQAAFGCPIELGPCFFHRTSRNSSRFALHVPIQPWPVLHCRRENCKVPPFADSACSSAISFGTLLLISQLELRPNFVHNITTQRDLPRFGRRAGAGKGLLLDLAFAIFFY